MAVVPSLSGYIFAEKLGKGSYATVYKAYQKGDTRDVVAIKCVQKSTLTKSAVENIITEISILKKVKHDHIVELKDFQWDNTYIFLILEYCSGGDLSQFIRCKKRLPESVAQKFLQQLAKALQVLRSQNIAHMDLKPQNILLSSKHNPVLKLGDFGLAQYLLPDSEASSLRGSPLYMAPEILLKQNYDARVDLWSVGIILYECLFGQAPFSSQTFAELAEKIKSNYSIEIPYGAQVGDNCRTLILGLLQRDPNKRITFESFFNDPFVDLEHMPTPESYTKGVNLVQEAVLADSECRYAKAIELYSKALEYLVPHMYGERDSTKRREFRKKILEYISRAEELKTLDKVNPPESNTEEVKNNIPNFEEMLESKPLLKQAFLYSGQADALVNLQNYEEASKFYQEALEIMVPAVTSETGPKKELLYKEVRKCMEKAEDLKSFLSILKHQKRVLSSVDPVQYNTTKESMDSTCIVQ